MCGVYIWYEVCVGGCICSVGAMFVWCICGMCMCDCVVCIRGVYVYMVCVWCVWHVCVNVWCVYMCVYDMYV